MDLKEQPQRPFLRHPWEVVRYAFFERILKAHNIQDSCSRVLDAGAGDAWIASKLSGLLGPDTEIICWDQEYETARAAEGRVVFTNQRPNTRFDLVLLLDVLEHIEDDSAFLDTVAADNLEPGGFALVSVPAWGFLYSEHDRGLGHHRRYAPRRCRWIIEHAGLSVLESGGLFHSLMAPRLVEKILDRLSVSRRTEKRKQTLEWKHSAFSHGLVCKALENESRLSGYAARKQIFLPGLSWWALCQKTR